MIELLVVIAIVALLMSMIMPSLAKAREQGKRAVCKAYLRSFVIICSEYAHDYNHKLPSFSAPNGPHVHDLSEDMVMFLERNYSLEHRELYCPSIPKWRVEQSLAREREPGNAIVVGYNYWVPRNLFDGACKKMLHIAPEKKMADNFRKIRGLNYLSADLNSPAAMVKMDITDIEYPNNSFDIIYCSHVLEHIPDDGKALSELFRVLKLDGWMLLSVPIKNELEKTEEDLELADPQKRLQRFGNIDHVRNYGRDFDEKLTQIGFQFEKYHPSDIVSKEQFCRFGLKDDPVYICKKH